ncbi:hypothetical protein EJ08DRAFT_645394 [Tothia fuscella]|uniref:Peroxin/Ferlin domain-containing protein n=1 Tax=Tothia fuscella TaxID=1048955 RepID=A0A9P4P1I7_9PEZI|nr:hypothetical protein EJ08DRAFT_645394 [Tothia fuscella]
MPDSSNAGKEASRVESSLCQDGAVDGPIVLVDHTKPAEDDAEPNAENGLGLQKTGTSLSQKITKNSLRQNLARRNYQRSRWQEGGGHLATPDPDVPENASNSPQSSDHRPSAEMEGDDSRWGEGRAHRGRRKVKGLIKTPKKTTKVPTEDPNNHVDILYENQRGLFLFGIPHFSSNSLLNFDPSAWLDARFKPSAVDITNAQVPDPSWEWLWRTWYVDMSYDVDEEGWEYSFWFGDSCAWHGTHPWFHSFVRRRRWLRQRVRRHGHRKRDGMFGEGHMLNADYFTIHSQPRPRSVGSSLGSVSRTASINGQRWGAKTWEEQEDAVDVHDIPTLMKHLKESTIDREKTVIVTRFLDQGGEELHYLAEQIPDIMALFVFQSSRMQLLSELKHRFTAATAHREEHRQRDEPEDEVEKRTIDNLLNAMNVADEQCRQLEFWSDIRKLDQEGGVFGPADHSPHLAHEWKDGTESAPTKEAAVRDWNNKLGSTSNDKGKAAVRDGVKFEDPSHHQDASMDGSHEAYHETQEAASLAQNKKLKEGSSTSKSPSNSEESKAEHSSDAEREVEQHEEKAKILPFVPPVMTRDDIPEGDIAESSASPT